MTQVMPTDIRAQKGRQLLFRLLEKLSLGNSSLGWEKEAPGAGNHAGQRHPTHRGHIQAPHTVSAVV